MLARTYSGRPWSVAAIAAILGATFFIDILTPPGVAAGVFPYFIAVFATVRMPGQAAPYIVATVASLLTISGFFATAGDHPPIILINRVCIVVTLYIVAYLASNWIRAGNELVARRAAEETESRYRDLFDTAPIGMQIADHNGRRLRVNEALVDMLGYESADEVMSRAQFGFIAPHDRASAEARVAADAAGGERPMVYEIDLVRRDGSVFHAQVFWRAIEWEGRSATVRYFIDITERYRAEQALMESDAMYRDLFDGSRLGQHIADTDGQRLVINQAFADLLGYDSPAEVMALPPFAFAAQHERTAAAARSIADALQGALPDSYEIDLLCKDGTQIRTQVYVRRIVWDGAPATQRTFIDVTERYRAQEQLSENEERLRLMLNAIGDGLLGLDEEGFCTFCNPAGLKLLGFRDASDLVGRNMHALIHSRYPDGSPYPESACGILKSIRENRITEDSHETFWRADGTPIPIAFRALPIRKGDAVVGAVLTFCDLTRARADAATRKAQDETIRALQRELSEAARESALGELSSVIAHELNQPLTAIRSTADAAKRQLAGNAPGRLDTLAEMLPFLSEQAERAGNVLDGVRRMFERDTPERSRENLHEVIDEACLLARREFGPDDVTIEWTPGTDPAPVIIDRIQIQQVLYNLIKNAAEAMSGMPDKTVSVSTAKTGRQTVEVRVSDHGPGIAPDAGARMFEPFVTTKEHGMGMGLHTCRTIVRAHGGEIGIDPADLVGGGGATVRFTLRLAENRGESRTGRSPP